MAVEFIGAEPGAPGKPVKGAPYSAEAVTETTQTLPDGNRIRRKTSARMYRDGEGRTRRDASLATIGLAPEADIPQLVFINDPVSGSNYVLNMKERTAQKSKIGPPDRRLLELRAKMEQQPHVVERRVEVRRGEGDAAPAGVGMRTFEYRAGRIEPHEMKVDSLGRQMIEGVEADGVRTTFTIPAGKIGNERPIEIVSERWTSPELQTLIMSRHSDPRSGETTYRLINISRSEPPHSLFEVPADFKISEGGDVLRWRMPLPPPQK
jgi:hypothetical protein